MNFTVTYKPGGGLEHEGRSQIFRMGGCSVRNRLEAIVDELAGNISEMEVGEPVFGDERYDPYPIEEGKFRRIPSTRPFGRVSFIDGGNLPIVSTPSFSVHLVRVYFNLFEGCERVDPRNLPSKLDFYSVATAREGDGEVEFVLKTVPADDRSEGYEPLEDDLVFSSWDRSLMSGNFRAEIDEMGGAARKFAEWKVAGLISEKELGSGDLIVHDGTLQSAISHESDFAQGAYERAQRNGVVFSGLAKTSRIYTSTGNTLVGVVKRVGDRVMAGEPWYYHPVADIERVDHPAEIFMVKLHPESDYVFRYEILKRQAEQRSREELEEILGELARNSRDASFPGYPYGLVDADRFARVRRSELESHEGMLKSVFSGRKCWSDLKEYLMATDAHSVLDSIQGGGP